MKNLTVETGDAFSSLLELAANNDVEAFKQSIECDPSAIDELGLWYGRKKGSKKMVYEHRTPLMVAALYGSIDVLNLILSLSIVDVNRSCGLDKSTALHCAASGGSVNAVEAVKLLLKAGADLNMVDANGHHPVDAVIVSPKLHHVKLALDELLAVNGSFVEQCLRVSTATSNSNSPALSSSPRYGSLSTTSESPPSPMHSKFDDQPASSASERKEYLVDPSLPDIKNSIYSTNEFRMYSFKVRPCSRAYSHDWTECPFVHPGENARRRDPRKYHYSCVPCPDFRKGACWRGDMCEYAHGVFECWLHPAQYRTRLCKDGKNCMRRVCFFAHAADELRPLYLSTGSAVPSPHSSTSAASAMEIASAMNFLPTSPSSVMSPSPFTPSMSPSVNSMSPSSMTWPQPEVPSLRLLGGNLQSSRLRSSLHARDIPLPDFDVMPDFDVQQQQQLLDELPCLSIKSHSLNRPSWLKALDHSNLNDMFSADSLSPRCADQPLASAVYSPTRKTAVLNQFQQQQQSMLSPINTGFSPKNVEHPLLQGSLGVSSPGRMSPLTVGSVSPMSARGSMFAHDGQQLHPFRSLSSRDLGSNAGAIIGSPLHSWTRLESFNGKPDMGVNPDEQGKLRRSSSFELGNNWEEPDLWWVQSLVKESPTDTKDKLAIPISDIDNAAVAIGASNANPLTEAIDHSVIGGWIEQMQLDQLVASKNQNALQSE
ncbi:hypothetical protein Nepgr_021984 [Nepenthes gracilis]|uniref:C3H1-type domain-containing protein n=1 Tax=Nepenthes gracilis TaxID=150966 RepID=A0AAD3XWJ4_NEPGR|nr:hypothetical protein Nepgr_021984 [Nepenthes gracilis]